jgi:hypothetical protein
MSGPSMWSRDELDQIARTGEVTVTTRRADGRSAASVTIWVVVVDDEVYVRSYRGEAGGWYRRAVRDGRARIAAIGLGHDVAVAPASRIRHERIDAAYHAKYDPSPYTRTMVAPAAAATTLQLTPRRENDA